MKLRNSVKPISYLKAHASEIVRDVSDNHKTFVITQHGEAKVVVQDIVTFEKLNESLALLKMLALSTADIKAGRTKPLRKAFKDVKSRLKKEFK